MNKEEKMQDIPAEIRPFLTRRRVLQAGAIGGAAAVAAACGAGGSTTDSSAPAAEGVDISETDKKVVWSNWQAYMPLSETDQTYPVWLLSQLKQESKLITPRITTITMKRMQNTNHY